MAYLNKCMLIGNIGKDPEIRTIQQGGRKCVRFSLATTKRYRDNNGETKEGELTNRTWTDQTTRQKRFSTEVNMGTFQLLTPRNQSGTFGGNGAPAYDYSQPYNQSQQSQQPAQGCESGADDDLPFDGGRA